MSYASLHPDRVASLFCLSPPCTEKYDPETYCAYGTVSQIDFERWETPKETDWHLERTAKGLHGYHKDLHSQGACMKKFLLCVLQPIFEKGFLIPIRGAKPLKA